MTQLELTNEELLTTTRAVRKRLDFDRPVELDVVKECLQLALQAPTGSNSQRWQFVLVRDDDKKLALAELYRRSFEKYRPQPYSVHNVHRGDAQLGEVQKRVVDSVEYLAQHMERVPLLVIPCMEGRVENSGTAAQAGSYGSILPTTWSFMLAARTRGLGTCWTTLHLSYEKEAAEVLGIPYERVTQVAMIPVAYTLGTDFKPGVRRDVEARLHMDGW